MGSVARTYEAASRCPTCGGSKLPPKRAISGIEEKPQPIPREGVALRVPESAELRRRCALVGPGPERGAAGEQIDGRFVVDELVLLRTPAELRRILGAGVDDGGNAQGRRVSAKWRSRRQPCSGTTRRSQPIPSLTRRAYSPEVRPWRAHTGQRPTNDSNPVWTTPPSTASPPMGLGRSSTRKRSLCFAAAFIASPMVARYV